jgi:hypothetical protein
VLHETGIPILHQTFVLVKGMRKERRKRKEGKERTKGNERRKRKKKEDKEERRKRRKRRKKKKKKEEKEERRKKTRGKEKQVSNFAMVRRVSSSFGFSRYFRANGLFLRFSAGCGNGFSGSPLRMKKREEAMELLFCNFGFLQ